MPKDGRGILIKMMSTNIEVHPTKFTLPYFFEPSLRYSGLFQMEKKYFEWFLMGNFRRSPMMNKLKKKTSKIRMFLQRKECTQKIVK